MSRNQRSAKNILIRPREQLRFAVVFFAASSALLTAYVVVVLTSLMSTLSTIVHQYDLPPEVLPTLLNSLQWSVFFVALFGVVLTLGMLAMGVTLSHRIFGPLIPMGALISKLKAGEYGARADLRKNDEFKELAGDLNDLAEKLQTKYGEKS